jgi:hypothetical protein
MRRAAALGLAWLAIPGAAFAEELAASLTFVHVEANVGGASGGHAALRVEDTVFHVQQSADGLFRLLRQDWGHFRHVYAGLQNRGLRLAHVAVSGADRERVLDALARAHVVQEAALARRDRLERDLAWLRAWAEGRETPPLRGAGLLSPELPNDPLAAALRERVATQLGVDFLSAERAQLSGRAEAFGPEGDLEALRETLLAGEAVAALAEARGLAPEAVTRPVGATADPLSDAERAGLEGFARAQERAVLDLLVSARPDRGHPLHLAIARWLAVQRSLASGTLELLDPYPDEVQALAEPEGASPAIAARLAADAASVLRQARASLLPDPGLAEPAYNLLELAAGLAAELDGAALGGPLRELPARAAPGRGRTLGRLPVAVDPSALAPALASARRALDREREALRARFGYDVLRRNCITELVRLVNDSFEDPDDAVRALGGRLEPGAELGFVPFVFFEQVTKRLRTVRVEHVASHRRRELARLRAEDPGLARRLREATTLTSSIYTPRRRDGAFLLFTDDTVWARPVLGALNLGFALGRGALGVPIAPFDRGARLRAGFSGVLFSVPELVFLNFRKGSFDYVEPEPEA